MSKVLSTIQKRANLNYITRRSEQGPGGAYHEYSIDYLDEDNDLCLAGYIIFQKGPRHLDDSIHGVTDQDLLEIVRDRLTCFANGDMPTPETKEALKHVEIALMYLNKRIEDRLERDVLGTYEE